MTLPRRDSWTRLAAALTLLLLPASAVSAQYRLEVVHGFSSTSAGGNAGGAGPVASLLETSDGSLWGTTRNGGTGDAGVIFQLLPDRSLSARDVAVGTVTGKNPRAALILASDGNFYGSTESGGAHGSGMYFRMTPAGTFTTFDLPRYPGDAVCSSGPAPGPTTPLVQAADGSMYGLLSGVLFFSTTGICKAGGFVQLTLDGTLTKTAIDGSLRGSRGAVAIGPDGRFYWTALPISNIPGATMTAFARDAAGQFTAIHSFSATESGGQTLLLAPDGNFYSTLTVGGAAGKGIVYRMTPAGAVTTLHEFQGGTDGDAPTAGLVLGRDGYFYGVTSKGGPSNAGTIFRINAAGDYSVVYAFTGGADGGDPEASLIEHSDGSLYGTAAAGGPFGGGVVFRIKSVAPEPRIAIDVPAAPAFNPISIQGWAIDRGAFTGTGIDAIHVYAFPNPGSGAPPVFVGVGTYGSGRADVASTFGTQFASSGFSLSATLPGGTYLLAALGRSTVTGTFSALATRVVTVVTSQPLMSLDLPASGAVTTGVVSVGGWAIDRAALTGTGIEAIHVWAVPNDGGPAQFVGVAPYGISRPDIGAIFGAAFTNSGFLLVNKPLPPGTYTIAAFAWSTVANTFNNAAMATNVVVR